MEEEKERLEKERGAEEWDHRTGGGTEGEKPQQGGQRWGEED